MREILFRGKRIDNNKWIYGDFVSDGCWICHTEYLNEYGDVGDLYHQVVSETVGQFTGLTDKNGKKIFEGDIVKDITDGVPREVFYCNESAMFLKKGILRSSLGNPLHLEVIGNIHDNPELLGG